MFDKIKKDMYKKKVSELDRVYHKMIHKQYVSKYQNVLLLFLKELIEDLRTIFFIEEDIREMRMVWKWTYFFCKIYRNLCEMEKILILNNQYL